MNVDISQVVPGMFGVSHGSGLVGELIRTATQSWAGHCFIYVGSGRIIEGIPPVARIASATEYDDAIWAYRMPVSSGAAVIAKAHALVGTPYDYPAYVGFALEVLGLRNGTELDPVSKMDKWLVCSALVDECYQYANMPLDWSKISLDPGQAPNLVSPAMLLSLATVEGWV
jgi:uncharacterized protein YycO